MLGRINHIHFVGIGGAGMSGLALITKNLGYKVSGSDITRTSLTKYLSEQSIKISYNHDAKNSIGASVIVYSSAIRSDNPEIIYAHQNKIPVIPRAEMLAELMRMKFSIAVSGTHGKTTTTSLISAIMEKAVMHPTIIIGGKVVGTETTAKLGKSEYLIAEADESDRSFLLLFPTIAIITNIEREHMDHYSNISEIKKAFAEFANKVPFFGSVILGTDSQFVRDIIPFIKREYITFGFSNHANVYAENIFLDKICSEFDVHYNGKSEHISINLPGKHNIENALAAICVALKLQIPFSFVKSALRNFQGIHRRLELKGIKNGITVYDDYAHHPTEIIATLATLRNAYPQNRIITIFQPHRYSRTQSLRNTFGKSFNDTNILVITDIYAASESKIPGVTSKLIIDAVKKTGSLRPKIIYKKKFNDIIEYLIKNCKPQDVIITLGAGNIWQTGDSLLKKL